MSALREQLISPRQERALSVLLQAPNLAQAARELGINERTLRRWIHQPAFSARLEAVSRDVYATTVCTARAAAEQGVDTLRDGMKGRADKDQIAAAKALLGFVAKIDVREARIAAKMAALQNLTVRLLLWYSGIVESHVTDPATRQAIKRDFLALGAPAGEGRDR